MRIFPSNVLLAGTMTGALDMGGYSLCNFKTWGTSTPLVLSTNASTAFPAITLTGLGNSKTLSTVLGVRIWIWETAALANRGPIDLRIALNITTSGAGVATCTPTTTLAIKDVSMLPAALAGATADIAESTDGFTVSVTRPTDLACTAHWDGFVNIYRDVTP